MNINNSSFEVVDSIRQNIPSLDLIALALTEAPPAAIAEICNPFALLKKLDRQQLPAGLEDAYPLTRQQASIFHHNERHPDLEAFHHIPSFNIRFPFHRQHLQTAIDQIVDRHAALRTSFDLASYSEPLQLVHRVAHLPRT